MIEPTLVTCISLGLIAFALIQVLRYRDVFHPLCHQAIMVALLLGVRPFFLRAGFDALLRFTDDEETLVFRALVFYLGFFAIALLTYAFVRRYLSFFRRASFALRTYGEAEPPLFLLGLPYLVAGVAGLAYLALRVGIGTFIADVAGLRGDLFTGNWTLEYALTAPFIAATLYWAALLRGDRRPWLRYALVAAAILGMMGATLSGFRGYVFTLATGFLAVRAVVLRRIPYGWLVGFAAFVLLAFPLMDGLVYGGLSDLWSSGPAGAVEYYKVEYADRLGYFYGRYYTLEGTARTLALLDEGQTEFDGGRLVWSAPQIILPTALVGEKPSVTQEITRAFFGDYYHADQGTGTVTSLPAFMYWQLGWGGYLLAGLAYGLFLAYWTRIYEAGGLGSAVFIGVTAPYFLMMFVGHTGSLAEFIYVHLMLWPLLRLRMASESSFQESKWSHDAAPLAAALRP